MFSNLMLSWAVATYRKFYCKSDDPPWHIQEYPKLCVFYTGALTTISMSKRTPNDTYLLPKFPMKCRNDTHWCEKIIIQPRYSPLPTYSSTIPSCLQLFAMFIIMKATYNESIFSKQELPIDGVTLKRLTFSCV